MFAILLALSLSQIKRSQIKRYSANRYNLLKNRIPRNLMDESVVCNFCLEAIDKIDELLEDDKLEEEIIQVIDQYCQKLPSPYSSLCVAYVESGIPLAISYIKEGIDTFDICGRLGLCDPTKADAFPHKVRPTKPNKNIPKQVTYVPLTPIQIPQSGYQKATGYEMCNSILNYLQKLLSDKTAEDTIKSLILEKCGTYNSPYSSLCKTLSQQYYTFISTWIEGQISNADICTKIGLCEN